MRAKKASSVKPHHPSAIWVNQIATGRWGVFFKRAYLQSHVKRPKMLFGYFGTFAVATNF
jgi:hypothetical protein